MTEPTADDLRRDFLGHLDAAMADLPHRVATDIHDGIEEELNGLDADATAARIARLGDPGTIAREAQAEVPARAQPAVTSDERAVRPNAKVPVVDMRGYAITSALVFAFGGFLVPVVGWFIGVALVSSSTLWRRWEKVVAIVLPLAAAALAAVVLWLGSLVSSADGAGDDARNPLVPSIGGLGLWHSGVLLVFVLIPVIGGWLLWRLRHR